MTTVKLNKFQYSSTKRKKGAQCWHAFYHMQVAKTYPFTETPAIEVGRIVDDVLEQSIITGQDPDLKQLRADLIQAFPEYKFMDSLIEGVDAAFEYAISRTGVNIVQTRLALDRKMQPTPVNWFKNSPLFDSCQMDLMTIPDDHEIYIDDWKTGNPNYPDYHQLQDYALYAFRYMPKLERVHASLVWLRKGRHKENIVHKSSRVYVRSEMRPVVQRWADFHRDCVTHNENGNWPKTLNSMCRTCDHYEVCRTEEDGPE